MAACGSIAQPTPTPNLTARQYFDRAGKHLDTGEYQKAIDNYDDAIRLDPQYSRAYNNKGIAYKKLAQPDRAIQDFDEAIRLDSEYAHAYFNRGIAYNALGQYERAIQDFDEAIRHNPQ